MLSRRVSAALLILSLLLLAPAQGCAAKKQTQPPPASSASPPAFSQAPAPRSAGFSPVAAQMLRDAGRDPGKAQPEKGFALSVPASVHDGAPFVVSLGGEGLKNVTVEWKGKKLLLAPGRDNQRPGVCEAMLAVPLDAKEADYPLVLTAVWANGKTERFAGRVPVARKDYPVQRLTVQSKFVNPPPEMQAKIKRDRAELREAIARVSPVKYWSVPLQRPVPGDITSLYGLRRVFNGQPKSPHRGVDYDAKEGDPIQAMDAGVVVLVSEHYYGGNTVIIDHGLGVYSLYLHLSAFQTQVGKKVARGETIGLIGSTGRVTGPHLHLSFCVLGDMVNGQDCVDGL